ncbi:MAG: oxidoreductase [Rhodobacteraceae bacterium]|nr:oxidoreductase [Paracoccaceae bacterium]
MTKVALITGGARGIGRAIVDDLASDHDIAFTWSSTEPVFDDSRLAIRADLAEPAAAGRIIDEVMARFGRLDVIVNNAGIVASTPKSAHVPGDHKRIMDVNYLAPVALLSAALPHLKPGAAVVSISSVNAVMPPRDAVTYGASKAAINLWTKGMAKELGPLGIRVNAVAPGAIELPEAPRPPELVDQFVAETALGRAGVPQDIARAVRFLASDAAGFITGEILTVSGGYRL